MSVTALRLRQVLRRHRSSPALLAVVVVLGSLVAAHHLAPPAHDAHDGMDMGAVAEMCLGVLAAVGALAVAVVVGVVALGRWRPATTLVARGLVVGSRPRSPSARAGPGLLQLLCVSRR